MAGFGGGIMGMTRRLGGGELMSMIPQLMRMANVGGGHGRRHRGGSIRRHSGRAARRSNRISDALDCPSLSSGAPSRRPGARNEITTAPAAPPAQRCFGPHRVSITLTHDSTPSSTIDAPRSVKKFCAVAPCVDSHQPPAR
jgi:hypothetical protein